MGGGIEYFRKRLLIMHYKNGREVKIGDWVVGRSHNRALICGIVIEMMPKQGPCNIKVHIWVDEHFTEEGNPVTIPATKSKGEEDYGDSKDFIAVSDGLKMVSAVVGWGNWNAPYLT